MTKVVVGVRLEPETNEQIERLAERSHREKSEVIRLLVEEALSRKRSPTLWGVT